MGEKKSSLCSGQIGYKSIVDLTRFFCVQIVLTISYSLALERKNAAENEIIVYCF